MGRPLSLTKSGDPGALASAASYNAAGQMTGLTYGLGGVSWTETNAFNALGQLTRQAIPSVIDFEYTFSATANNGQIEKQKDWITGDEQNYTYDALKRLATAATTNSDYGLSFGYDGFGNKLSQTVTKGSAPASSITVDAYNHITGQTYDANGNMTSGASSTLTYDVDNRVVAAAGLSSESYSYDPGNKRIWKKRALGGGSFAEDVYFYGIGTGRLGIYTKSGGSYSVKSADVRFAGKLIYTNSAWIAADRLGSIRYRKPTGTAERLDSFPYGEERPSATAQDRDKFATYMRDDTGLDYADQRYFTNTSGRFVTPDPAGDGSNWYAYAGGDPVNSGDPTGLAPGAFEYFGVPVQGVVEPPQPVMEPPAYAAGGFASPFFGVPATALALPVPKTLQECLDNAAADRVAAYDVAVRAAQRTYAINVASATATYTAAITIASIFLNPAGMAAAAISYAVVNIALAAQLSSNIQTATEVRNLQRDKDQTTCEGKFPPAAPPTYAGLEIDWSQLYYGAMDAWGSGGSSSGSYASNYFPYVSVPAGSGSQSDSTITYFYP